MWWVGRSCDANKAGLESYMRKLLKVEKQDASLTNQVLVGTKVVDDFQELQGLP